MLHKRCFPNLFRSPLGEQTLSKSLHINWMSQALHAAKIRSSASPRLLQLGAEAAHVRVLRRRPLL